ncbi:MAG TPA: pentapeptide repeat-containing protein [Gemmataceae bacterium]
MTKRTLARPAKADRVPLKLKGKTVAFAGKFGKFPYQSRIQSGEEVFGRLIETEGGTVVADVTANLDYLVIGQTRGRTEAEKQAERLNQKHGAAIQILDENGFHQRFALTRDKAVGLDLAAVSVGGKIGPNILELEKIAKQSRRLETVAVIDLKDHPVELKLTCYRNAKWISAYTGTPGMGSHDSACSLSAGMIDLARRWTNGTLRLTSITAKGNKGPYGGKQLQRLAIAAWCEACGVAVPSETEIAERFQASKTSQNDLREQMLQELRCGAAGIKRWNARCGTAIPGHSRLTDERRKAGHFRRVDLSNLDLSGAILGGLDFQGAVFDGASLVKANLDYGDFRNANFRNARLTNARCGIAKFSGADFTGASLYQAHLRVCTFRSAVFDGADLRGADFGYADLRGADLSGADLSKVKFEHTKYNEETHMPPGFKHIDGMEWKGGGPASGTASVSPAVPSADVIDFGTLMERLRRTVHSSSLSKALQMLKADRFQLYAEVRDDALVGVVKSQSDPNLVYSCRLGADGAFACCTQNLRPCGGLHGKLCKHLLVLLVGLAKSGQLEPAAAERWAQASRHRRPALNKDAMSETFLRYKGAEAGEVDWRPTETIPEDYYAL